MLKVRDSIEVERPKSLPERDAVMSELETLLSTRHFRNSKRYPALLRHIVTHALEGNVDALKERTLGVEVFKRNPSYDTSTDTIVRYTASEVRKRLQLYYHELDYVPEWQFLLPAGSYTPRFLHTPAGVDHSRKNVGSAVQEPNWSGLTATSPDLLQMPEVLMVHPRNASALGSIVEGLRRPAAWGALVLILLVIASVTVVHMRNAHATPPATALQEFWTPVLEAHKELTICTGGSSFADGFSGTRTAGRDEEYPFISIQVAEGLIRLGNFFGSRGAEVKVIASASTQLSAVRDKPLILIGGYNNPWTLRLLEGLRFHFSPNGGEHAILDSTRPETRWFRQRSVSYGSADDYALISRFRNGKTGDWVIILAGIGRNGTEAAALFVTEEGYLQQVQREFKGRIPDGNLQIVLHLSVVEGKTGSPEIVAISQW